MQKVQATRDMWTLKRRPQPCAARPSAPGLSCLPFSRSPPSQTHPKPTALHALRCTVTTRSPPVHSGPWALSCPLPTRAASYSGQGPDTTPCRARCCTNAALVLSWLLGATAVVTIAGQLVPFSPGPSEPERPGEDGVSSPDGRIRSARAQRPGEGPAGGAVQGRSRWSSSDRSHMGHRW